MGEERPYLRTKEVAELLGVSGKTVSRWAAEGKLPSTRTIGGHRRYRESDIRELREELLREVGEQEGLRAPEVAAIFNVSVHTVTRWANEGRLPSTQRKPGKHRRYPKAAIHELFAASGGVWPKGPPP
jgi:excisionase family DNA binding protein